MVIEDQRAQVIVCPHRGQIGREDSMRYVEKSEVSTTHAGKMEEDGNMTQKIKNTEKRVC